MTNKFNEIKDMLEMIDIKINHIEDMVADNRSIIIKLVKQNNSIVEFLKQIEIDDVTAEYEDILQPPLSEEEEKKIQRFENLKEILNEFMDKRKDLIEFEKELKKHKDQLTPGQIGES